MLGGANYPGNRRPEAPEPTATPPEEVDAGDIIRVDTTLVTIPGLVVQEPIVQTPFPLRSAMRYTSGLMRAAARNASLRRFMGVLPECAAWP